MTTPFTQIEGKFEILQKLHEGGMGAIYKVQHRFLKEPRVVKMMRRQLAGDVQFRNRFLKEAQLAASLKHPNIAQIHDFTVDDSGTGFIVMEFIDGVSLKEILQGHALLDLPLVLEIARQALRALGFLHRKGYIHRDISPDNVMLGEDVDGRPEAKLIDLGIAKKLDSGDGLTTTGHFLGKLRYSSPEHFGELGASGVDARSDVYSFGLVLYELLTGQQAVRGNDLPSLSAGHLHRPPTPFAESDPGNRVPEDLRALVLQALAKDPAVRFVDAQTFAEALAEVQTRFPLPAGYAVRAIFDQVPAQRGSSGGADAGGSTQVQLDRQFGVETTPTQRFKKTDTLRNTEIRLDHSTLVARDEDTGVYRTLSSAETGGGAERTRLIPTAELTGAPPRIPADAHTTIATRESFAGLSSPPPPVAEADPGQEKTQRLDGFLREVREREAAKEAARAAPPTPPAGREATLPTTLLQPPRSPATPPPVPTLRPSASQPPPFQTSPPAASQPPSPTLIPSASQPPPFQPPPFQPSPPAAGPSPSPTFVPPPPTSEAPPRPAAPAPRREPAPRLPESRASQAVPVPPPDPVAAAPPPVRPPAPSLLARLGIDDTTRARWLAAAQRRKVALLVGGGGVALLVLLLLLLGRDRAPSAVPVEEPEVVEVPPSADEGAVPEPAAAPSDTVGDLHPELRSARQCLDEGDYECAAAAVETIYRDQIFLKDAEKEVLAEIETALAEHQAAPEVAVDRDVLAQQLADAFANGPVTALRDAVDTVRKLRRDEPEALADQQETFAAADKIIIEYRRMWGAKNKDDHLEVIRLASRLLEIYPPYAQAAEHRDTAAAAVEQQAEAVLAAGDPERFVAILQELQQAFPERPGLTDRIAREQRRMAIDEKLEAQLAKAEAAHDQRDPEAGLAILAQLQVAADSPSRPRYEQLKTRLDRLFADMDRSAPTVHLAAGQQLEYERRRPARLKLEVRDEFRVEKWNAWARFADGEPYKPVTLRPLEGAVYLLEIPPEMHDNAKRIDFYVVVEDPSGHQGAYGDPKQPITLKRKGIF